MMNNYDFNYNGSILEKEKNVNKKICFLKLKWLFYFLIGFTTFQIIFFFQFSIFSVIVSMLAYYVALKFINSLQKYSYSSELDQDEIFKNQSNLEMNILIISYIVELIYSLISKRAFYKQSIFENADDFFIKNFALFTIYVLMFKVCFILYIRFYMSKLRSQYE